MPGKISVGCKTPLVVEPGALLAAEEFVVGSRHEDIRLAQGSHVLLTRLLVSPAVDVFTELGLG